MPRQPHSTAIARKGPSAPLRWLMQWMNVTPGEPFQIDYGCGRGADANHLACDRYDPHWAPNDYRLVTGYYDLVLCTYVLNAVSEYEQANIIEELRRILHPRTGVAYITVRRDLKTAKGIQRIVKLDLPVVYENSQFCIYKLVKSSG